MTVQRRRPALLRSAGSCVECEVDLVPLAGVILNLAVAAHRWGDGPLRWIQCLLFLDLETEVHQFTDFDYAHYHFAYNKKIVCRNCATAKVVG